MRVTDTKSFIIKAKSIHNDKYDYSLVNYVNAKTKVNIICKVEGHGVFEQMPSNHTHITNPKGCRLCGFNKVIASTKSNTNDFVKKAKLIHGDTYDYSLVDYIKWNYKVKIKCSKGHVFYQTPNTHLNGSGCSKCKFNKIKKMRSSNSIEFIEKAELKHGGRYKYDKLIYVNRNEKVIINCPNHGYFEQKAGNHLSGRGCSKCSKEISKKKNAILA